MNGRRSRLDGACLVALLLILAPAALCAQPPGVSAYFDPSEYLPASTRSVYDVPPNPAAYAAPGTRSVFDPSPQVQPQQRSPIVSQNSESPVFPGGAHTPLTQSGFGGIGTAQEPVGLRRTARLPSGGSAHSIYGQEDPLQTIQPVSQIPQEFESPDQPFFEPIQDDSHHFLSQPPVGSDGRTGLSRLPGMLSLGRARFVWTWLPGGGDTIGMNNLDLQQTLLASPIPGLTITPGFGSYLLEGPTRADLPPRLFEARIEFTLRGASTSRWSYELAVTPGINSDFNNGTSNAFRLFGRGMAYYSQSQTTQFALGVLYLDRENVKLLPAFGVIWTPAADLRAELIFPRPRILKCIGRGTDHNRWLYLSGEYGGNSYAIDRASGRHDVATYSDWRLILGLELQYDNGRSLRFEAGYVFNRELEYRSGRGDFDPDETGLLRVGVVY